MIPLWEQSLSHITCMRFFQLGLNSCGVLDRVVLEAEVRRPGQVSRISVPIDVVLGENGLAFLDRVLGAVRAVAHHDMVGVWPAHALRRFRPTLLCVGTVRK